MVAIIDSPDFMFSDVDLTTLSKWQRLIYFIKGLIVGYIFKKTKEDAFCNLMNFFFRSDQKIQYKNGIYSKKLSNGLKIFYPNKRIVRVIKNPIHHFQFLYESYCLEQIKFNEGDVVIDCGANIGELAFSFDNLNKKVKYFAFEPEPETFKCLSKNLSQFENMTTYNFALSNDEETIDFFVDAEGGNSSLEYFGTEKKVTIDTKKIDSFKYEKVKLIKIEAEGHEESVIKGSLETLKRTEYVAVDYGPEKGVLQNPTISEVVNLLYRNQFQLISSSKHRQIGLFKNQLIENE